jgi:hypothetical protein
MSVSFREIAKRMDQVEHITSLKVLAERHRWLPEGSLPSPVSFRRIANRHSDSSSTDLHFLWYNTALLPGIDFNLCDPRSLNWILDKIDMNASDLLEKAGIGAEVVLKDFGKLPVDITTALGITDENLKNAFKDKVDELWEILKYFTGQKLIEKLLEEISVGELVSKFSINLRRVFDAFPDIEPLKVMSIYCGKILDWIGLCGQLAILNIAAKFKYDIKPDLDNRALGIASILAKEYYDIVAMCEVFTQQSKDNLLRVIKSGTSRDVHGYAGPDSTGNNLDSGLYTVTFDRNVPYSLSKKFNNRGCELIDADAWANKGILLTTIDVGLGELDIYSTHLISGGDFKEIWKFLEVEVCRILISEEEFEKGMADYILGMKMAQIDELLQFYSERRLDHPQNVAIIVGDFNLIAKNECDYAPLISRMYSSGTVPFDIKFLDFWPYHRRRPPYGIPLASDATQTGATLEGKFNLGNICSNSAIKSNDPKKDGSYCDEDQLVGDRIDFIFVENPRPEHAYTLDLSRARRRPFFRGGDYPAFLSDHLGLEVTLYISPNNG